MTTAQDILIAMQAKYAAMQTYQDRGVILTKLPDEPEVHERPFATFFQRPGRLRFEWTNPPPYSGLRHLRTHSVIWNSGAGAFLYSDRDGLIKPQESLMMAIAGATGVSGGAAHSVSSLLMPDVGGFTLAQLQRPTLQDGECDGVRCHRIGGYHRYGYGGFCEVFVGVHDLLLRRVSEPGRDGVSSDELRTDIREDEAIDEQIFDFRPP